MASLPPLVARRAAQRVLPSLAEEPSWLGPFTFAQAADTQFGLIHRYIDRLDPYDPSDCAKEVHLTQRLVASVNKLDPPPRFLIVCGDMIDAFPPGSGSEGDGDAGRARRRRQLAAFGEAFGQLRPDVPLVCVCGNHDMGDVPTPESVISYRDTWGDDYFEFWIGGCQLLCLNSQFYANAALVPGELASMQAWLLSRLSSGSPAHRLVFMHIPPFVLDAGTDPDNYFTLPKAVRIPLLDALVDAGVATVFCGHYHRNAGGWYRQKLEIVVTSAVGAQIGQDRHGYRLVTVARDAVRHRYVEFECPVNLPEGKCQAEHGDGMSE